MSGGRGIPHPVEGTTSGAASKGRQTTGRTIVVQALLDTAGKMLERVIYNGHSGGGSPRCKMAMGNRRVMLGGYLEREERL